MLADEPHLQFVGPQYIADHHIICPVISQCGSQFRQFTAVPDDDLVSVEQAGELDWNFLPSLGRPFDSRRLRHIVSHGDAEAAEQLNALGDGVDQLRLLTEMLVEKQMKLVEGRPRDLPMGLLVQIAESHGIGQ